MLIDDQCVINSFAGYPYGFYNLRYLYLCYFVVITINTKQNKTKWKEVSERSAGYRNLSLASRDYHG